MSSVVGNARAVCVYENNTGQMIDDVRLSLLGSVPVEFIGGMSLDSSGFGIAPDLDVDILRRRILEVVERYRS
jgi:2-oxoglutarate/2-oxoacid ferredoxin oxidoreductase subunit alpha